MGLNNRFPFVFVVFRLEIDVIVEDDSVLLERWTPREDDFFWIGRNGFEIGRFPWTYQRSKGRELQNNNSPRRMHKRMIKGYFLKFGEILFLYPFQNSETKILQRIAPILSNFSSDIFNDSRSS